MKKSVVFKDQFKPKLGRQFEQEAGGQFALELGGQFDRFFYYYSDVIC